MQILKDPACRTASITTAMAYSRAAMSANWKNTLLTAMVLLLLGAASMIPLLGIAASMFQTLLFYALAFWFVHRLRDSENIETFRERAGGDALSTMLTGWLSPAVGYYVGFMLFSLLMIVITGLLLGLNGGFEAVSSLATMQQGATRQEMAALYAQLGTSSLPAMLFLILSSLFFSYLWPLVYGYALLQERFTDAFNAVFMFFSPRFWRATFHWPYMRLVSLWMLIVLGTFLAIGVTFATLVLIPLGLLLTLWLSYFTAAVAVIAYDGAEEV